MPQIQRIGIQGFRRLETIDIRMRPMMALIGANGVGKTSFMDALSLLADSARGALNRRINEMGGVSEMVTKEGAEEIVLRAEMGVVGEQPLEYYLSVQPQGPRYSITTETLIQSREGYDEPFKHIESYFGDIHFYDPERAGIGATELGARRLRNLLVTSAQDVSTTGGL